MENQRSINGESKVKLMCSYGGKIQQRQRDNQLAYVGGDTKILTVDRRIKFSEIFSKLSSLCSYNNGGGELCIKYQLPGEDLDALVSIIDDDDVEHMMVEYDRMGRVSEKPNRLRLFLFNPTRPVNPDPAALNPDFLFGFDKEYQPSLSPAVTHDLLPGFSITENSGPGSEFVAENGSGPGNSGSGTKLMLVHHQSHHLPHGMKMVYGLPVLPGAYPAGVGQFSVVSGGDNFFPAVPVPEKKAAVMSNGEKLNPSVNGDHQH